MDIDHVAPVRDRSAYGPSRKNAHFQRRSDATEALPSLFIDPDARGTRRWSQMFDLERCEELAFDSVMTSAPSLQR
ncbi:hypothetical protein WJT74_07420 [Sphingomicrobium sp. XHP0239]|uniref:hypothetical protein n=1 Tax=Sphingomicrobium maritimum TaxID=3133972 RepID=UPI0031CC8067